MTVGNIKMLKPARQINSISMRNLIWKGHVIQQEAIANFHICLKHITLSWGIQRKENNLKSPLKWNGLLRSMRHKLPCITASSFLCHPTQFISFYEVLLAQRKTLHKSNKRTRGALINPFMRGICLKKEDCSTHISRSDWIASTRVLQRAKKPTWSRKKQHIRLNRQNRCI